MELTKLALRRLAKGKIDTNAVEETLDRIAAAVPHLEFSRWEISKDDSASNDALGWSHYLQNRTVLHVHVQLPGLTIASEVRSRTSLGYIDKAFLESLADEAARLFTTTATTIADPTVFGLQSVATALQKGYLRDGQGVETALRFLRRLSTLTYENQRISYGILLADRNGGDERPLIDKTTSKRLRRLSDGVRTVVELDHKGRVVGLRPLAEPSRQPTDSELLPHWMRPLAGAATGRRVGLALTRSGEILAVAGGRMLFAFRSGKWVSWRPDLLCEVARSIYKRRGRPSRVDKVIRRIMSTAVELSFRRSGGLFAIANSRTGVVNILGSQRDRIGSSLRLREDQEIDRSVEGNVLDLPRQLLVDIAALDGAVVVDRTGVLHGYGALVRSSGSRSQGARTRASEGASRYGMAIKVSSDGAIDVMWEKAKQIQIG